MEKFAKTIISIYGNKALSEGNRLHDYAYRSWSGIMKDLYKARFEKYFGELRKTNDKNADPQIDWFEFDYSWTATPYYYTTTPAGCPVNACKYVF